MKFIRLTLLGALLVFGIIYQMNKVAPAPMPGLTANDGKTVVGAPVDTTPSEGKFEPLDLSQKEKHSFIGQAYADEVVPVAVSALTKTDVRTMGNVKAPVKMYVFSSLTCSHCAGFHTKVLKGIEEKYIETGKVFMTYVDFPFDNRALAGAMLARCVNPDNYFTFLNVLFKNQQNWAFKPNAQEIVTSYAALQGLTKGDVKACLSDKVLQQKIVSDREMYMKKYKITGTPTTVLVKGNKTEMIEGADGQKLEKALKKLTE